ncbi:hypothetical protein Plhal304r1_c008g0030721 [Plasmopara halstedii]
MTAFLCGLDKWKQLTPPSQFFRASAPISYSTTCLEGVLSNHVFAVGWLSTKSVWCRTPFMMFIKMFPRSVNLHSI